MKTLWIVFSGVLVLIPLANTLLNTQSLDLTQLDENLNINHHLTAEKYYFQTFIKVFPSTGSHIWKKIAKMKPELKYAFINELANFQEQLTNEILENK